MLSATHSSRFVPSLMGPMPELMGAIPELMGPLPSMLGALPSLMGPLTIGTGGVPWGVRALGFGAALATLATGITLGAKPDAYPVASKVGLALGIIEIGLALRHLSQAKAYTEPPGSLVPPALVGAAQIEALAGGAALATVAITALLR